MIPRTLMLAALMSLVLFASAEPAFAGKRKGGRIDVARQRVRENKSKSSRSSSRSRSRSRTDDSSDRGSSNDEDHFDFDHYDYDFDRHDHSGSNFGNELYWLTFQTLIFPFSGPVAIVGENPFRLGTYRFGAYPYAGGLSGHVQRVRGKSADPGKSSAGRFASLRLQSSYERHADNLDGVRLRGTLRTAVRFNLDASVTRYREQLESGTDELWHYKVLGMYSFAVSPHVHFSAGVGVRSLMFRGGEDAIGFISRYSAEFFPVSPLHLWVSGELGGGRGGFMGEVEVGAGLLFKQFEAYAGYRAFEVAGVPFRGPQVGLMLWL